MPVVGKRAQEFGREGRRARSRAPRWFGRVRVAPGRSSDRASPRSRPRASRPGWQSSPSHNRSWRVSIQPPSPGKHRGQQAVVPLAQFRVPEQERNGAPDLVPGPAEGRGPGPGRSRTMRGSPDLSSSSGPRARARRPADGSSVADQPGPGPLPGTGTLKMPHARPEARAAGGPDVQSCRRDPIRASPTSVMGRDGHVPGEPLQKPDRTRVSTPRSRCRACPRCLATTSPGSWP
jgi:hypothetical protein